MHESVMTMRSNPLTVLLKRYDMPVNDDGSLKNTYKKSLIRLEHSYEG